MASSKKSIREMVSMRLEIAYQSSAIGRMSQPGKVVDVPAPDDLVDAFRFFTTQLQALQEIVLVLANQIDELKEGSS